MEELEAAGNEHGAAGDNPDAEVVAEFGDAGIERPIEDSSADEASTLAYSREAFAEGQILGGRYRIRALLGRGGMGEVWRATDLKLRVDVALKALHRQLLDDRRALETLRDEVRLAREVVSPNVCRVFDLVELDGQELVSMEYIDGITLLHILKARAPLDLSEAREIAASFSPASRRSTPPAWCTGMSSPRT